MTLSSVAHRDRPENDHDLAATPRMARLMHERIGGSQVHVLPGLRHSLLIEAPERIALLLEGFL
jgi:pimeloyl-ACP methyl ester carboxylesterase